MSEGTTEERGASDLEAGYTRGHRLYELGGIALTTITGAWLMVRLFRSPTLSGWWAPLAAFVGMLFADFISGFVHWMFDTWGSVDTPVVGRLAIRTFRHHHVDQKAITRHDFIETNGHNIALSTICAVFGILWCDPAKPTLPGVFFGMSGAFSIVFVSLTSQIHKWAHEDEPSRVIRFLQRARIILSPSHHAVHHAAPYNRNYCITIGWMNGPLRAVRFFETLERLITAVTGVIPRKDDIGEAAALATLAAIEDDLPLEGVGASVTANATDA
jgi:ubiquitin-conjugating enzyme E2 variant